MARSRKSKDTSASDTAPKDGAESEAIEDAVVVDESGNQPEAEADAEADTVEAADKADAEREPAAEDAKDDSAPEVSDEVTAEASDEAVEPVTGEKTTEAVADETPEVAEPEPVEDSGAAQDNTSAEVAPAPAPPPPQPVEVKQVGFFPVLFGGVIAAALGAGALYYASERGWAGLGGGDTEALVAEIAGLKTEIGTLQDEISTLRDGMPELAPVNDAVAALQDVQGELTSSTAVLAETVDGLAARIDATDARVAEVETQPIPMAQLPEEIRNAYDRQVAAMEARVGERFAEVQGALDTRLNEIEATVDDKLAEIEAAQAAASDQEQQAIDAARAAEARAALAEIEVALDTGSGYGEALAALNDSADVTADAALADHAEDGVPSLAALQASFPDAARAALNASTRAAADSGDVNPVTAFLRTQLGARSLEPREGDDPDAVLSRAEAALGGGDLDATLTEIAALPEAGQAALAAWVGDAETRRAALNALADLSAQLNSN